MLEHQNTLSYILKYGEKVVNDRSGTGMISLIGAQERYTLIDGEFPLVNSRYINFEKTFNELVWFIRGSNDVSFLKEKNVPFWNKWTSPKTNTIGDMYPSIWRNCPVVASALPPKTKTSDLTIENHHEIHYIDQLALLVEGLEKDIQTNTISRRHYISNVNLGMRPNPELSPIENVEYGNMALDTCHREFFVSLRELTKEELKYVKEYRKEQAKYFGVKDTRPLPKYKLMTSLTMRSNDAAIGKPHNVAQYAMMNFLLAHILNCHPGVHNHLVHDCHIYLSHVDTVRKEISRIPFGKPKLYLSPELNKENFLSGKLNWSMVGLKDYNHHESLSYPLEG